MAARGTGVGPSAGRGGLAGVALRALGGRGSMFGAGGAAVYEAKRVCWGCCALAGVVGASVEAYGAGAAGAGAGAACCGLVFLWDAWPPSEREGGGRGRGGGGERERE